MTSRYRQSMTEAYNQVQLSEKEITKLKNGVKVLGNALPNRAVAQKMADKANKEMGHDADVYQSPFNNRFYVRIKEETLNEKDHEVSMARGELEAISDKALKLSSILQGKSDEGNPLEAWVQSKITKAKDYINSVADYMEYNPDNAMEGKVECPKCEGKGCEHCDNKGYHITEAFSDAQVQALKKAYEPLRGKRISVDNANKLGAMFTKFDKDKNALEKLYGGDIPFVSTMAMTRLMTKHNYKAADLNKIRKESVELESELHLLDEAHMLDEAEATVSRFKGDKEAENIMSLAKQQGVKATRSGNQIHLKGVFRKVMDMSLALQRNGMKVEEIINEETLEEFTTQQIKMAYGVANDKRYKAGNYSGAVAAIEKIAKGLSKHPDVAKVLKRVNEDNEYTDEQLGEMFGNKQIDPTTAAALRAYLSGRAGGSPFPPIREGTGSIKGFRNDREKDNMISLAKQHGLKVKDVVGGIELSGNMRKILDMQLAAQGNGLKAEEVKPKENEEKRKLKLEPKRCWLWLAKGRRCGAVVSDTFCPPQNPFQVKLW